MFSQVWSWITKCIKGYEYSVFFSQRVSKRGPRVFWVARWLLISLQTSVIVFAAPARIKSVSAWSLSRFKGQKKLCVGYYYQRVEKDKHDLSNLVWKFKQQVGLCSSRDYLTWRAKVILLNGILSEQALWDNGEANGNNYDRKSWLNNVKWERGLYMRARVLKVSFGQTQSVLNC